MPRDLLLDTGPLVAILDAADQWHDRCAVVWPDAIIRCVTCEAVVAEASHLVRSGGAAAHVPLDFLLAAEIPILGLDLSAYRRAATLMRRYVNVPMDFADACLVVLAEALGTRAVFSTDQRGFQTYRHAGRHSFNLLPA